ncbi:unnamed protein product [Arctogadus glacialis]
MRSLRRQQQGHRTIQTSPAVSQTQRTLMLLLLLSLSLALPVYLSLRLALPQDHRAGGVVWVCGSWSPPVEGGWGRRRGWCARDDGRARVWTRSNRGAKEGGDGNGHGVRNVGSDQDGAGPWGGSVGGERGREGLGGKMAWLREGLRRDAVGVAERTGTRTAGDPRSATQRPLVRRIPAAHVRDKGREWGGRGVRDRGCRKNGQLAGELKPEKTSGACGVCVEWFRCKGRGRNTRSNVIKVTKEFARKYRREEKAGAASQCAGLRGRVHSASTRGHERAARTGGTFSDDRQELGCLRSPELSEPNSLVGPEVGEPE